MANEKHCNGCGQDKPVEEFGVCDGGRPRSRCKLCTSEATMRWRDSNQDRALDAHLRRTFGITLAEYRDILVEQGGVCAVCGRPPTVALGIPTRRQGRAVRPRLVVDHNHETGEIRGLLCTPCNRGIGSLGDTADDVRRALAYLERKG